MTTSFPGYVNGSATFSGITTPPQAALVPTFDTGTPGTNSFTFNVTNYQSAYTWAVTSTKGSAVIDNTGKVIVTGLIQGDAVTVTVSTSRSTYSSGNAVKSGATIPLSGALVPALATPVKVSSTSYSVQITNYDSAYTWSTSITTGQAVLSNGIISVANIPAGSSGVLTVTSSRSGYSSGSANVTLSTLPIQPALVPIFGSGSALPGGSFQVKVTNYDNTFTWNITSNYGNAIMDGTGLITVTGLMYNQSALLTVRTAKDGFNNGVNTYYGAANALTPGLIPTIASVVPTVGGFTAQVTNYDSNYQWTVFASPGYASINYRGFITVSGLDSGATSVVTVSTSRSGYTQQSGNVTGTAQTALPGFTPRFGFPTSTDDGFTVQLLNYDRSYTWSIQITSGYGVLQPSGLIVVSQLSSGENATVTLRANKTGYTEGVGTVSGSANQAQQVQNNNYAILNFSPSLNFEYETEDGFVISIDNYDSNYSWDCSTDNGAYCEFSDNGTLTVSGADPGTTTNVTVNVSDDSGNNNSESIEGTSLSESDYTPIFSNTVPTSDGYTAVVGNYRRGLSYSLRSTAGIATIDNTGMLRVRNLRPGQNASVTIRTKLNNTFVGLAVVRGYAKSKSTAQNAIKNSRNVTITCIRGNSSTTVTGINPVCPQGFNRK